MKFSTSLISLFYFLAVIGSSSSISKEYKSYPKASSSLSNSLTKRAVKKKIYNIPGSAVIQTAIKHGYKFTVKNNRSLKTCSFKNNRWEIPVGAQCNILAFQSKIKRCAMLRKGWVLKKVSVKGGVIKRWNELPKNSPNPSFNISLSNSHPNASRPKMIQIEQITLEGPEGKFNKYEEAFSHCSDLRYQL